MKKILVFCLLGLAGCSSKPADKTFVCFNPFNPLASWQFDVPNPNFKVYYNRIEAQGSDGKLVVPRSLCAEVSK